MIFDRADEKGVVAVIVAILFGFGVMFGAAALTIDVGNINADRRQLQNGADAVALAFAKQCANGVCPTLPDASLQALADGNAADHKTLISRVNTALPAICGQGGGLTACPSTPALDTKNLQECPQVNVPDASTNYVRVYTETENSSGGTILPYVFGATIAGVGSGATQQTCASVAWGPISDYTATVPITISLCMFDALKAQFGGVDGLPAEPSGAWPGYGAGHLNSWPTPSPEKIEYTTKYADTCANSNGHTANGSFGWLTNNSCMTSVTTGSWINGDPGNNEQCDMSPYYGRKILVPIFDCITISHSDPGSPPAATDPCSIPTSGGSNVWYHIAGWASFYLSGYSFPSDTKNSLLPPSYTAMCPAGGSSSCIAGWLTKLELSDGHGGGGGKSYGVTTLQNIQ